MINQLNAEIHENGPKPSIRGMSTPQDRKIIPKSWREVPDTRANHLAGKHQGFMFGAG